MFFRVFPNSRGCRHSILAARALIAGAALAVLGVTVGAASANAITILNPSFEATFPTTGSYVYPGYGQITDWSSTNDTVGTGQTGVNTDNGPFANNGAIPNGAQVAFIQSNQGSVESLSQNLSGFTAGQTYDLSFYYNARSPNQQYETTVAPLMQVTLGSSTLTPSGGVSVNPVSDVVDTTPYDLANYLYTATGSTATLTFSNINTVSGDDSTLLIDDVSLAPVPEPASLGLAGVGAIGLLLLGRRRKVV